MDFFAVLPFVIMTLLILVCILMAMLLVGQERRFRKLEQEQSRLKRSLALRPVGDSPPQVRLAADVPPELRLHASAAERG